MNGIFLARVGRSEAGKRIEAAGKEYERLNKDLEATTRGKVLLEALSLRLDACAETLLNDVEEMKRRVIKKFSMAPVHVIIDEVAAERRISAKAILSNRRARNIVDARHEVMYRALMETPFSMPQIGRILNRDHTTIGHGALRYARLNNLPPPHGRDIDSYKGERNR